MEIFTPFSVDVEWQFSSASMAIFTIFFFRLTILHVSIMANTWKRMSITLLQHGNFLTIFLYNITIFTLEQDKSLYNSMANVYVFAWQFWSVCWEWFCLANKNVCLFQPGWGNDSCSDSHPERTTTHYWVFILFFGFFWVVISKWDGPWSSLFCTAIILVLEPR